MPEPTSTIVGGIAIAFAVAIGTVTSRLVYSGFVEPVRRFRKVRAEIAYWLDYYNDVSQYAGTDASRKLSRILETNTEPDENVIRHQAELKEFIAREQDRVRQPIKMYRRLATDLFHVTQSIRPYWLWRCLGFVPSRNAVSKAQKALLALSKRLGNSADIVDPMLLDEATLEIIEALALPHLHEHSLGISPRRNN